MYDERNKPTDGCVEERSVWSNVATIAGADSATKM